VTFRGGLHVGASYYNAINATWPFVKLHIEKESIALSSPFGNPRFSRAQITKLSKYSGFFSKGLKIEHIADQPPFIVFWTFDLPAVMRCLEKNGYQFSE